MISQFVHSQVSKIQFAPLCPAFGLKVKGVDLARPMSEETIWKVKNSLFTGQVLVFGSQRMIPSQFASFARLFGPAEPNEIETFNHPEDPDILILSNVVICGRPQGLANTGVYFHTDYSYHPVPALATVLYSLEAPLEGGETIFADQYAAYEELPGTMKKRIDSLSAIHYRGNRNGSGRGWVCPSHR